MGLGEHGTIRTEQRGDGRWRARARQRGQDGVTRDVEGTGATERAATKALTARLRAGAGGSDQLAARSTVTAAMTLHLARIARAVDGDDRSPNTIRTYRSNWTLHLQPRAGAWRLGEVTVGRAEAALQDIADEVSVHVAAGCRNLLSAALGLAVRHGAIARNPVRDVQVIATRRPRVVKAIPGEQVVELLVALDADPWARRADVPDLVLWMLATTERIGNALAASWARIDLDAATADLGPNVVRVPGGVEVRETENSKRRARVVTLPPSAVAMLRTRRERAGVSATGLVFPNSRDTGPRTPAAAATRIRDAMRRAGFDGLTSHVLRKTGATALDEAQVTLAEIARRLGHTNDRITRRAYIAQRPDSPAVTAALEAIIARPAGVVDLGARRRGARPGPDVAPGAGGAGVFGG